MSVTATSRVATERGERYRKQLNRVKDVTGRPYPTAMSKAATKTRYPAMIAAPDMRPRPRSR